LDFGSVAARPTLLASTDRGGMPTTARLSSFGLARLS